MYIFYSPKNGSSNNIKQKEKKIEAIRVHQLWPILIDTSVTFGILHGRVESWIKNIYSFNVQVMKSKHIELPSIAFEESSTVDHEFDHSIIFFDDICQTMESLIKIRAILKRMTIGLNS